MAEETIFSKIIRREIPSDVVYQDELVTAFRDISPQGANPYSDRSQYPDSHRQRCDR
ncbi:YcfF/hinT protein: a purine nucleoside phosphoramidase [Klebsiella michiganensis]|uniref:YcfF/hinT protein: a purine nucleoside phosphoramidase n=1 Tax=Klebsiella michiganensis TaxID=1134687 RepID=A0A7H4LV27_9ENTR|nr:YcfF/hinT protein: a purine nucleoside phosphoramidase [Klebsiella michiganensis]